MSATTQRIRILHHLIHEGSITSWQAIKEYGATRLSAIIFDLKAMGWDIDGEFISFINRYGDKVRFKRYFLTKAARKYLKHSKVYGKRR